MKTKFGKEMADWRLSRLKELSDQYAELPENFRALLAKAARIPEERHGNRLDHLTADQRQALLDALRRLRGHCDKAWPLLLHANPPGLPL